ncbi:Glucooligosaccharide oxidase [Hypholoma sublateritium FD-334 SS-4]|uniref:Glucooligosaccharide oxidase n=1 Tax=Hypholoma sublateritium (strain FD-334 SS-4) TaxID=945553 RepID=A0A0D2KGV3_HYPSF|nr:Glucooligosaccharide oxidase [Hypholoma sublateritium FD-334 SS-4]
MVPSLSRISARVLLILSSYAALVTADLSSDLSDLNFSVLVPGNSGYPSASAAFNRRFTFQPSAIFFPITAQDVSSAIKLAVKYNHQVVARSGGHSYIANGLGGKNGSFVVDMSNFNTVSLDTSTNIATIGPGNRLGDVALALNNNGRAMPHGTCPYVGIGGHSGHGGYGFTSRKWGLTLDTIVALDIVLANGTIVTASNTSNADLFWGLRGASSSLGVVTAIHANTFAAPSSTTIFEYTWDLSASAAASALAAFQTFVQEPNLPQEFAGELVLGAGSAKGRVNFGLTGGWYGPANQYAAVIAPFLAMVPAPQSKKLTVGTYINSVQYLGGLGRLNTTGIPDSTDTFYAKSLMTPTASPISITAGTAFMTYLANQGFGTNTDWFVEVELYGGTNSAINNVPRNATAFFNRDSIFTIQFYTSAPGGVPPFPAAGFTLLDGMVNSLINNSPSGWAYGAYANYIDDRLNNWQGLYYGGNYPQLETLKKKYDPTDILNFPLAIQE